MHIVKDTFLIHYKLAVAQMELKNREFILTFIPIKLARLLPRIELTIRFVSILLRDPDDIYPMLSISVLKPDWILSELANLELQERGIELSLSILEQMENKNYDQSRKVLQKIKAVIYKIGNNVE